MLALWKHWAQAVRPRIVLQAKRQRRPWWAWAMLCLLAYMDTLVGVINCVIYFPQSHQLPLNAADHPIAKIGAGCRFTMPCCAHSDNANHPALASTSTANPTAEWSSTGEGGRMQQVGELQVVNHMQRSGPLPTDAAVASCSLICRVQLHGLQVITGGRSCLRAASPLPDQSACSLEPWLEGRTAGVGHCLWLPVLVIRVINHTAYT